MIRKYLAWDIEIFNSIPAGATDWKAHMPLGVSCAAMIASDESNPILWHAADKSKPMSAVDLDAMIEYMAHCVEDRGYTIVTHNGTSFDWWLVAIESNSFNACANLAMHSIDTMFHFLAIKGYRIGLDAIAKGCGLPGKTEGMNGALAPELWQAGDYDAVLDYVVQDVVTTLQVTEAVELNKGFNWIAKSGRLNSVAIPVWLTVVEAMQLPLPNTSWMQSPITREEIAGWASHSHSNS